METTSKRFTDEESRIIDSRISKKSCIMCGNRNSNTIAGDFRCGQCPEGHERAFTLFFVTGERTSSDLLLAHQVGDCSDGCW